MRRLISGFAMIGMLLLSGCGGIPATVASIADPVDSVRADELVQNAGRLAQEAQYLGANHYLQKALEIFQKTREWEKAIQCYIHRADNFQQLEDFEKARMELNTALELTRNQMGFKHLELARGFIKMGNKYVRNQDFVNAVDMYRKALLIQREILGEEHPEVARTYNYISRAFFNKGDTQQGNKNYHKSLSIKLRQFQGVDINVMENYRLLDRSAVEKDTAGVSGAEQNLAEARNYLNKSLAVYRDSFEANDPIFADIYDNIGILYALEGQYEKSLELLRKAFAQRLELFGDDASETANSYHHIGVCLRMMKDYENARYYLQHALDIRDKFPSENLRADRADIFFQLGKTEMELNAPEKALDYYQRALIEIVPGFADSNHYRNPAIERAASRETLLKILAAKGDVLKLRYLKDPSRLKDLRAAYSSYQLAVGLTEEICRGFKSDNYKIFFVEKSQEIFDEAIQAALMLSEATGERSFCTEAFTLSEQGKASVLADTLAESHALRFAGIPAPVLEKERKYKDELDFYDTLLEKEYRANNSGPEETKRVKNLENRYYAVKEEYARFIANIETQYPRYYELRFNSKTAAPAELQKALPPETAILEYFIGRDFFTVFVVDSHRIQAVSLPILEDFNQTVEKFYLSIKKIDVPTFLNYCHALYQNLAAPVEDLLRDKKRLIIIPHSGLFYVPFEALTRRKPLSQNFQDADFLVRHFIISYHYSARLWLLAAQSARETPPRELSFAGFAPIFNNFTDDSTDGTHQNGVLVEGKLFPSLPATEREIQTIRELFAAKQKKNASFLHREATEAQFKNPVLKLFSIIHVATHSITEKDNPKLSGILFAQGGGESVEDGVLYSGETYNLDLNAELIVLSSCESGIGKLYRGEGMIGLNRGFLYSGVKNTIFSLWQVEDATTSRLMIEFYRAILDGGAYASALRQAKLAALKDPFTAFPRYWSGFLLVGP